jgi:hypothetical protein
MNDAVSALIITPVWGAFMSQVAQKFPREEFKSPEPVSDNLKPVMRGIWQGGVSYFIDTISNGVATEYTPRETKKEIVFNSVHSILQWVDKRDPLGPVPANPSQDSQYNNWEYAVRNWFDEWKKSHPEFTETTNYVIPEKKDDIHTPDKLPKVSISSPASDSVVDPRQLLTISLQSSGSYPIQKAEVYLNGKYVMTNSSNPLSISFVPADVGGLTDNNTISISLYDSISNRVDVSLDFTTR